MNKEQKSEAGDCPEVKLTADAAIIRFEVEQIMVERDRQEFINNMNA